MEDRFSLMLKMQLELQKNHMGGSPQVLTDDAMADFMRWNAFALEDEVHEAMAEVSWKPWTHGHRTINEGAFLKEMVDAFHFFMNMLLCALPDSPEVIADKFTKAYLEKNAVNAQRQIEGYTGLEKCAECHRDLGELPLEAQGQRYQGVFGDKVLKFCSKEHHDQYKESIDG